LFEIGLSSSPPCPLPRGVVLCPKLDFSPHPPGPLPRGVVLCPRSDFSTHPPVLYREGWFFVQNWTFLLTPWSSTKRGGPFSEIGLSSSPPCPLPRGVVLCPKLDFSPHPPSPLPRGVVHLLVPSRGRAPFNPSARRQGSTRYSPRGGGLPLIPLPGGRGPPVSPLEGASSLQSLYPEAGVHPLLPSRGRAPDFLTRFSLLFFLVF
jgi:hypothetical protein